MKLLVVLCVSMFVVMLSACADEAEEESAPLSCDRDLPREECAAAGCTTIGTTWGVDHTDQALPQACDSGPSYGPSTSCLPLLSEDQGNLISFFQRDLPNGDKEIITLSNLYPPDALVGWTGCWPSSAPLPADSNYVECRCDY
jgi:hypothetical protein